MKISAFKCVFLIILATFFSGCREAATFEVALHENESLTRGAKVFLDGQPVATIEDIYLIGPEDTPVARIRLNDKSIERLILKGTQRKPGKGEIHLESPNLAPGDEAQPLLTGSRIPLRSIPLPPAIWPPNQETLIFVAIILVLLLVAFFVIMKFIKVVGTMATLIVACLIAYATYPQALPYAEKAIQFIEARSSEVPPSSESREPVEDSEAIDRAMTQITGFLKKEHLNPTYVAFGSLAIVYYMALSVFWRLIFSRSK